MDDKELAAIRARHEEEQSYLFAWTLKDPPLDAHGDRGKLLVEVDRLRAREAASLVVVQALAEGEAVLWDITHELAQCYWCDAPEAPSADALQHTPACPITQARALLASKES